MQKLFLLFYILLYFVGRYVFETELLQAHQYGTYIFEGAYVLLGSFFLLDYMKLLPIDERSQWWQILVALILGALIFKGAEYTGIPIPFDMQAHETVLFLLLVGPVLEEFLFRGALWGAIEGLMGVGMAWILTSAFFALGHFYAYFKVPEYLHSFIIYQSVYTLAIGLWWGWGYRKRNNLLFPVLLHLVFNLGFYLSSRLPLKM